MENYKTVKLGKTMNHDSGIEPSEPKEEKMYYPSVYISDMDCDPDCIPREGCYCKVYMKPCRINEDLKDGDTSVEFELHEIMFPVKEEKKPSAGESFDITVMAMKTPE